MIDFRPVLFTCGALLSVLAISMIVPATVDAASGNEDWRVFTLAAALTLFIGVSLVLTTRSGWSGLNLRQAFLITNLAWLVTAAFGALPFVFSEIRLSPTDAFFEAMSGVTTTGATVILDLDRAPPGLLLWRSILHWLGGIGIIVMAVAILPVLRVGGMQMFRIEAFETDKVLPRAAQIAGGISLIYLALTALATLVLWLLGMSGFDAWAHAMSSIATGGFSTKDSSVAYFDNAAIDWAVTLFMVIGSLPFVLYLSFVRGNWRALIFDSQIRWFLTILIGSILACALWLWLEGRYGALTALRYSAFNLTSMMTGSGFASADFSLWGGFAMALIFGLMLVGGCAGSTTCGIKVFRIQVLYAIAIKQLRRLIQPHGVFIAYYNRKSIPPTVEESVMSFFFLFAACFAALALALGLVGLDPVTALSGAASAIANVGPGLGSIIGPAGTFEPLPDSAKWLLTAGMLLGRLELFTVLVMLAPSFWRN